MALGEVEKRARQAAHSRRYYRENKNVVEARRRAKKQRDPAYQSRLIRAQELRRKYGLTVEAWAELFVEQGEACAVCGATDPRDKQGRWHTDHDHRTGKVRGILCSPCNLALGKADDSIDRLLDLANCLRSHK